MRDLVLEKQLGALHAAYDYPRTRDEMRCQSCGAARTPMMIGGGLLHHAVYVDLHRDPWGRVSHRYGAIVVTCTSEYCIAKVQQIAERHARAGSRYPFGDPCTRCWAASRAEDPRDRECRCKPCPTCGAACGNLCGYCERSLGCRAHNIGIDEHVEGGHCLSHPWEREQINAAYAHGADGSSARPLIAAIARRA